MRENWPTATATILSLEGGFVHDPADPGGATKFGITARTLGVARTLGRSATADEVRKLTADEASRIYRSHYWNAVRADDLPAGLDLATFDAAVLHGVRTAARYLQEALGVTPDGIIGPITIAAAHQESTPQALNHLASTRIYSLTALTTWPRFGRGWSLRVLNAHTDALQLAQR